MRRWMGAAGTVVVAVAPPTLSRRGGAAAFLRAVVLPRRRCRPGSCATAVRPRSVPPRPYGGRTNHKGPPSLSQGEELTKSSNQAIKQAINQSTQPAGRKQGVFWRCPLSQPRQSRGATPTTSTRESKRGTRTSTLSCCLATVARSTEAANKKPANRRGRRRRK